MDINFQYLMKRGTFGKQTLFSEHGPEMCDNLVMNPAEHKLFILRNPVHIATQNTTSFSENLVNTYRAEYTNSGVNHAEGGWPRDVNVNDPEATQRYRRKVEKEDGYIRAVMALTPGLEHYVLQNNAIDMYDTYYTKMPSIPKPEENDCRIVNVFRDHPAQGPKRPVSSICWEPGEDSERYSVSYVDVDFYRKTTSSLDSYIWNVQDPNAPETVLISPNSPVVDLRYCPRVKNLLAGGLIDGTVCGWDLRASCSPEWACPPHVAHRDFVRSVIFVAAKSGMEFFSGGAEGVIKWWDMRKLSEPLEELITHVTKNISEVPSIEHTNGITMLEYEHTIPTRFMVATETGLVLAGNRKGKSHCDKLPGRYEAHVGPVDALERNPAFLKNFLTVGDYTLRVWSEDCREGAVLWSPPQRYKITHATWSPTRVSLILLTQCNGQLAVWDILRRQHKPVLTMQVCHEPLVKVQAHVKGKLVVCASNAGDVYLAELSPNLCYSDKNDKALLTAVFDRESKRERILEARRRELRLKQRQAEEGSPTASLTDVDYTIGDRDLAEATTDYFATVKKEFAAF